MLPVVSTVWFWFGSHFGSIPKRLDTLTSKLNMGDDHQISLHYKDVQEENLEPWGWSPEVESNFLESERKKGKPWLVVQGFPVWVAVCSYGSPFFFSIWLYDFWASPELVFSLAANCLVKLVSECERPYKDHSLREKRTCRALPCSTLRNMLRRSWESQTSLFHVCLIAVQI